MQSVGKLFALFVLVPLLDIALLFQVGSVLGTANTLLLVIATGAVGAWLFRREGSRAWLAWQEAMAQGRLPEEGILGAAMLLVGAAWLLTPGVVTDAVGFLLLLPPTRKLAASLIRPWLKRSIAQRVEEGVAAGTTRVRVVRYGPGGVSVQDTAFDGPRGAPSPASGRPLKAEVVGRRVAARSGRPRREVIDADFEVID